MLFKQRKDYNTVSKVVPKEIRAYCHSRRDDSKEDGFCVFRKQLLCVCPEIQKWIAQDPAPVELCLCPCVTRFSGELAHLSGKTVWSAHGFGRPMPLTLPPRREATT